MAKVFRFLGILVGVLLALVLAAVIALPMVVDPNDFKEQIVSRVNAETGRSLTIEGDLELSVFPWLGVDIGRMRLSNAQGFGDQPFAAVNRAAVQVRLLPLFRRELQISSLSLDGLRLNLSRDGKGRANWDDLLPATGDGQGAPTEADGQGALDLALLTVGGVEVSDARIAWDDRQKGVAYALDRVNLTTGAIAPGRPVDVALDLVVTSTEPAVESDLSLVGKVNLDRAAGSLAVDGLNLAVKARGQGLPPDGLEADLTGVLEMLIDGSRLDLKDLVLSVGDLRAKGDVKGSDLYGQPVLEGALSVAEFSPRQWLPTIGIRAPETADPAVLARASAELGLAARGGSVALRDLRMQLDETTITGNAGLKEGAITFELALDQFDADRYLPPRDPKPAQAAKPAGRAAPADETLLPFAALTGINANGVFEIGRLVFAGLEAEGIRLTLKSGNGLLELDQTVPRFYQGNYEGSLRLDARTKPARQQAAVTLSGVNAGPLLRDLTGEERLLGKGRFKARVNTSGNSTAAMTKALAGTLDFEFADGAVKGINVAKLIRDARAAFEGRPLPRGDEPLQTDFTRLSGSAVIEKGVLSNDDLLGMSPFLRVTGGGKVDLVAERLDYEIRPVVVNTDKGQGGEGLEDLEGVTVPVRFKGPWASPGYKIDWTAVLVSTQGTKIEEKKEELLEKVEERIQEKLKGLFR